MMGRTEVIKFLLAQGVDINQKNNTESTPLHAASLNGFGEEMTLLQHKGITLSIVTLAHC
jgi:ankyrin repeat protein